MHGIFVSIKKVLSLPDGCIGWCTSRAVSVHYSFHLHLFPLLLLFLTASQLLSLYHINASSKATFQVSAICVIQTPSDIFCCLDESMYQRNFLFNLGPRRAENNRSITVLLWDAWPSYIQRKLLHWILCFFFWAIESHNLVSLWPLLEDQACPNSSFFSALPWRCWDAASPEFTDRGP